MSANQSYIFDALGRLKELRLEAEVSMQDMSALPAGAQTLSGTWDVSNGYLEETSGGAGRLLWMPAAIPQSFSFRYWSGHDPQDPDGDEDTSPSDPDHFS